MSHPHSHIDPADRVADIWRACPEAGPVFTRHRIDLCCRGAMRLDDAAAAAGVDVAQLVGELAAASAAAPVRAEA